MLKNSSILITGGTGSFGHAFVRMTLDKYNPKKYKPLILAGLWGLSIYLGYILIFSIYGNAHNENINKIIKPTNHTFYVLAKLLTQKPFFTCATSDCTRALKIDLSTRGHVPLRI